MHFESLDHAIAAEDSSRAGQAGAPREVLILRGRGTDPAPRSHAAQVSDTSTEFPALWVQAELYSIWMASRAEFTARATRSARNVSYKESRKASN
jgi:hypothetical protein